jgi:hypothetical protein
MTTVTFAAWPIGKRYVNGPLHRLLRLIGGSPTAIEQQAMTLVDWHQFMDRLVVGGDLDRVTSCGLRLPWVDSVVYDIHEGLPPLVCGDEACFGTQPVEGMVTM